MERLETEQAEQVQHDHSGLEPKRSEAQIERQAERHRDHGRYSKVNPCYVCGESAGVNYQSHPDTDRLIGDELLVLCAKCAKKCEGLNGIEAIKLLYGEEAAKKDTEQNKPAKKERHVCSRCHSKRDARLMHTMAQKFPSTYRRQDVTRFGKEIWYCNSCPDDQGGLRSRFRHGGKRETFLCLLCQQRLPKTEQSHVEGKCSDCWYKEHTAERDAQ